MYYLKLKNDKREGFAKVHTAVAQTTDRVTPNDLIFSKDQAHQFAEYDEALYFADMMKRNPDWSQWLVEVKKYG